MPSWFPPTMTTWRWLPKIGIGFRSTSQFHCPIGPSSGRFSTAPAVMQGQFDRDSGAAILLVADSDVGMQETVAALQPETSDYIIKTASILSAPANEAATRLSKAAPKLRKDILSSCEELRRRTGEYPMIQEVVPGAADSAVGVTMVVSPKGEIVMAYCVRRLRLRATRSMPAMFIPTNWGPSSGAKPRTTLRPWKRRANWSALSVIPVR